MPHIENWHYSSSEISKQEKKAVEIALEKGFWPTESYKGNREPWEVKCIKCDTVIKTTYKKFILNSFKCDICNPNFYEKEIQVMLKANLKPLEPYSGNSAKTWKCQCMLCGLECFPRYYDVSNRGKGGCKPCSLILSPESVSKAIEIMRVSSLEPIKPYVNSYSPWECVCMKCGEFVTPSLHNVQRGNGGCVFCKVAAFKHGEPAYLYLVHHEVFAAFKVGIGNFKTVHDRIESHKKYGWELLEKYSFEKGSQAFKAEKKILEWIRNEKGLPQHLTNKDFKHGGATETFSDDSITQLEIKIKMEETIKGLVIKPSNHSL
jgi:hypothetical protein